ncbi:MAG TPA: GatB/YqeY domain-containing protein [Patescibacteria group bacterium]|nr:GatB/YqeY domain-containing protein [Patescibacteria group bacterium]
MLLEKIQEDIKDAMKQRDQFRVDTLRMAVAAIKNERIVALRDLGDDEVIAVLQREIKKRNDSVEQFQKGNRPELAEKEKNEISVLEGYVPAQMSDEELETIVSNAIEKLGGESVVTIGQIMKIVMPQVQGKATGQRVSDMVKKVSA